MAYVSASTGQQIKAVLFDTFGTVVDWRSGVARDVAAFAGRRRLVDLDAWAFTDAWRASTTLRWIRFGMAPGTSCHSMSCTGRALSPP